MKKLSVVFERMGENIRTAASPRSLEENFTGDLNEKIWFCRSADDDGKVEGNRYLLLEVTVPEWMSFEFFKNNYIKLMWFMGFGGSLEWNENAVKAFLEMNAYERYVYMKFYASKPRKEFRKSLHKQMTNWLENPESRKYNTPLSRKQFSQLSYFVPRYEVESLNEKIYWRSQSNTFVGLEI